MMTVWLPGLIPGEDALCRVHIVISRQTEGPRRGTGGNDHGVMGIGFQGFCRNSSIVMNLHTHFLQGSLIPVNQL